MLREDSPRNTPPRRSEWGSSLPPDCFVSRGSISPCEYFLTKVFNGEALLAPRPTYKLEDHPSSAVRDCLFNIFAATLHIGGHSSIRNLRTRHAVVTGTHLSRSKAALASVFPVAADHRHFSVTESGRTWFKIFYNYFTHGVRVAFYLNYVSRLAILKRPSFSCKVLRISQCWHNSESRLLNINRTCQITLLQFNSAPLR